MDLVQTPRTPAAASASSESADALRPRRVSIVMLLRHGTKVRPLKAQVGALTDWHDVIHYCRWDQPAVPTLALVALTQRMLCQE